MFANAIPLYSGQIVTKELWSDVQLVPPPPPLAVQSTAIRSASPVSTLNAASTKTERDLRSRISIVGSYALKGSVWAFTDVETGPPEG